ncbi:MAG: ribosome silencing factor [Bacteroidota bacterium]|jgi:ribosome-associated protein
MTSKSLSKKIANAALSKKANDIVIMDIKKLTTMADFFVVCSVDSDPQARAVADAVKHDLLAEGELPVRKEGYSEGRWILLDYIDVVIHIFHRDVRSYYNLEKLWGDAKFEYVKDTPPAKTAVKKTRKTAAVPPRKKAAKK